MRGARRLSGDRIDAETPRREKLPTRQDACSCAARAGTGVRNGGEQTRIGLLFHEQRNVLENLSVVQAITGPQDVFAAAGQIVSDADPRAEVFVFVLRDPGVGAPDGLQFEVRARQGLNRSTV